MCGDELQTTVGLLFTFSHLKPRFIRARLTRHAGNSHTQAHAGILNTNTHTHMYTLLAALSSVHQLAAF